MPIKSEDDLVKVINDKYRLELALHTNIYGRIKANGRIVVASRYANHINAQY